MSGKMAERARGFHDVIAPPNDHLEVVVRDREGRTIQRLRRVGGGGVNAAEHFPVVTRRIADLQPASAGEEE